jgi:threonine synthase
MGELERQKLVVLRCDNCGWRYQRQHVTKCRKCKGVVNPEYDLAKAQIVDSDDSLERYFDLLPLECEIAARGGAAATPLLHARALGARYDLEHLWLKDETRNPTRTTKDRMAAVTLSRFREIGVSEFVASSTGNSSTSFGRWLFDFGERQLHAHLFCGKAWVRRHQHCDHDAVTFHVVEGNFVETGAAAQAFAEDKGLIWEGGFFNPSRREGLKLAYLEALDALPREPTVIVQAISSGMGLYGGWRGVNEYLALGRLRSLPRFVCVQQRSCAPMVRCYESRVPEMRPECIVKEPVGIAEAILRGDPSGSYPHMYRIVKRSGGTFSDVTQHEIEEAHAALMLDEGLRACPASAAAVAAVRKLRRRNFIAADDVVLVNVAGGMRPQAYGCEDDAELDERLGSAAYALTA